MIRDKGYYTNTKSKISKIDVESFAIAVGKVKKGKAPGGGLRIRYRYKKLAFL